MGIVDREAMEARMAAATAEYEAQAARYASPEWKAIEAEAMKIDAIDESAWPYIR